MNRGDCSIRRCGTVPLPRAKEYLLSVLGDMQGPAATRGGAGSPGDIAFRLGGDSAIAFVRGRVVVRLRNAGKPVVPLTAQAAAIDAWLQKGAR